MPDFLRQQFTIESMSKACLVFSKKEDHGTLFGREVNELSH